MYMHEKYSKVMQENVKNTDPSQRRMSQNRILMSIESFFNMPALDRKYCTTFFHYINISENGKTHLSTSATFKI